MTQLYKHKWATAEGPAYEDEKPTTNFLLWCRKTAVLANDQWKVGFDELEKRVENNSKNGIESWPPTYAEFLGICKPSKSPNGVNGAAYVDYKPVERLTDQTQEAKNKAAGRKHLDAMMGRG